MKKVVFIMVLIAILLNFYGCSLNYTDLSGDSQIEDSASGSKDSIQDKDSSSTDNDTQDTPETDDTNKNELGNNESDHEDPDTTVNDKENEDDLNSDDQDSENDNKEDDEEEKPACPHTNTKSEGAYGATCTKNGYTGDTVCAECNAVILFGEIIPATGHGELISKNYKASTCKQTGYTGDSVCTICNEIVYYGDTIAKVPHDEIIIGYAEPSIFSEGYTGNRVCSVCNALIAYGEPIPKLEQQDRVITINSNGFEYTITYPYGANPWEYTSEKVNKSSEHENADLETRIFDLLNEERVKAGLAPLEWDEKGYYYTKVRAEECHQLFSHDRPNGDFCFSVYYEDGVYAEYMGENIFGGNNVPEHMDWAQMAVDGWMNSEGHRENILYPNYTKCAIAFVQIDHVFTIVHHFYG